MTGRRLLASGAMTVGLLALLPATPALAHPLGNFTVNQHAGLRLTPDRVTVQMVVDMAEIPAFQTRSEIDTDRDKVVSPEEAAGYRQRACDEIANGVDIRLEGEPLPVTVTSSDLGFPSGEAGLATLRLTCQLDARSRWEGSARLEFQNRNFTNRIGWREIVAVGHGVRLTASDVPTASNSDVLTDYPEDLLSSPLDQRQAQLRLVASADTAATNALRADESASSSAGGTAVPVERGTDDLTAAFTGLIAQQQLTVGFGLLALVAAIALGAVHALAPGHGKTVMAAYLVGERGSLRQAALLGLTVTSTHTAGVLALGVLLSGSTALVPERTYPWLGLASGALLAGVGLSLLARAWRRRGAGLAALAPAHHHGHAHHHGPHRHRHHGHDRDVAAHSHSHDAQPPVSRKSLMLMGAAGGLVPSPSALVVLLGAIALGRTWFGISLVFGYGVGMALTLVAAGFLIVRARATLDRRLGGRTGMARLTRTLPVMTASFVVIAGVGLAARALHQM